ncbi:MAG: hypothetical protein HYU52_13445 [Acidobacteria bacterium]|nr:hypothetical protein [Acidobacteriota bacterium]
MKGFVANTDPEWFERLRSGPPRDEACFWRAGGEAFRALKAGEPFFFKLKAPYNAVAGFARFAHYTQVPCSAAWSFFGDASGVSSRAEMLERLLRLRSRSGIRDGERADHPVGCILLGEPLFFDERDWIAMPADFVPRVGQGKSYRVEQGEGRELFDACLSRARAIWRDSAGVAPGYEALVASPRMGPLSFSAAVLDAYDRRCAVTGESIVTALAAARIRVLPDLPGYSVPNGLLLRADLARLFEGGYLTVTTKHFLRVAPSLARSSHAYAVLDGVPVRFPRRSKHSPLVEALWWHEETRFLG